MPSPVTHICEGCGDALDGNDEVRAIYRERLDPTRPEDDDRARWSYCHLGHEPAKYVITGRGRLADLEAARIADRAGRLTTTRRLDWEALVNARDLGGYPSIDGRAIRWGSLIRSDSLSALTPRGQAALIDYGVRTVVDLRMPSEIDDEPNPFAVDGDHGVAYHNLPFIDPASAAPTESTTLREDYLGMLRRFGPQVAAVVTTIARAEEGGVLVHCAAGKDRTGLVVALLLGALEVPLEVIAEDYALTAESLRAGEARYLEDGPGDRAERVATLERVRARPEVMLDVLAAVDERYGGAAGYLRQVGVASEDLDRLRDRFVGPATG